MALIQLSSNLDNIKGSVGNITYSQGRSGIIEKIKSHPGSVHPFIPSQKQLDLRQSIRILSPLWKGLQEAQRVAWNDLAKTIKKYNEFGQPYFSSGFNTFIECNHNLQVINFGLIMDAPVYMPPPSLISFIFHATDVGSGIFNLMFLNQTTAVNVIHIIYATDCLSPGKSYIRNQYRFITTIPAGTQDSFSFSSEYNAVFPVHTNGKKIFVKLKAVNLHTGFYAPDIFSNSIFQ